MRTPSRLLLLAVCATPSAAQIEIGELYAPEPYAGQRFGAFLDASGSTIVVGARDEECFVYEEVGGAWAHSATLVPGFTGLDPRIYDVAIDGDVLFVGAPGAENAGVVVGYERAAGGWSELNRLVGSSLNPGADFGLGLALEGDLLVVGAQRAAVTPGSPGSGAVFVFHATAGGTWSESHRLDPATPSRHRLLGVSVATDGSTIVAGDNFGEDALGVGTGSAVVWESDGAGDWIEVARLEPPDGEANDNFGVAVAVADERIAVGARYDDGHVGAVYLFRRTSGTWTFEAKLVPSTAAPLSRVGRALAFDGARLLVGGESGSHVTGFERVAGEWVETYSLDSSSFGPRFGESIAVEGDLLVAGDSGFDESRGGAGLVLLQGYAFEACPGAPNSTGSACELDVEGPISASHAHLRLVLSGGPPRQSGVAVHGPTAGRLPLGDGELCVSPFHPGLTRLAPLVRFDAQGAAELTVDLGSGPALGVVAGSRHYLQVVYRDGAAGATGVNLSRAVGVTFSP